MSDKTEQVDGSQSILGGQVSIVPHARPDQHDQLTMYSHNRVTQVVYA